MRWNIHVTINTSDEDDKMKRKRFEMKAEDQSLIFSTKLDRFHNERHEIEEERLQLNC